MREQIIKEITEKVMVKLAEQGIELGSHKVELALVDDVQNLYNNANKLYKANTDSLQKFATKMESDFQKAADEYKKAMDKFNQLDKMSKDLGIALPPDVVK